MRSSKKIVFAVAVFVMAFAASTFAAPKEKALVVGTPNYAATYSQWLSKDFICTKLDKNNGAKAWKDKGYILPKFEELKQYKLVVICPLANTLAVNKKDIVEYVKNGGNIYYGYNSLDTTKMKTKEIGCGISGFDKLAPEFLKPYPKSGKMLHKLTYTKGMKKARSFEIKALYSVYAADLVDAEALVVNPEKKGFALACAAPYGKGKFIYFGSEDYTTFMDVMRACGLCK